MTIASLELELNCARVQFDLLNENRHVWRENGEQETLENYRWFDNDREARICELAERIARLHRFRSECFAKEYSQ